MAICALRRFGAGTAIRDTPSLDSEWGVYYQIGLDGYNILLVMLTAFLGPLVVASAFNAISKQQKLFTRWCS